MIYILYLLLAYVISTAIAIGLFFVVIKLRDFTKDKPKWVYYVTFLGFFEWIVGGLVADFLYNWTWACLVFWGLPYVKKEADGWHIDWLVTARLRRHIDAGPGDGWRYKRALWWCKEVIEKIDPGHCGLEDK